MIGLALGGGGVKGSYEIGAYCAFKKCHIKFDGITGTSIGSFNGAMIAAGLDKELLMFWQNADVGKILGLDEKYVEKENLGIKDLELLKLKIDLVVSTLKNKGISTDGLEVVLKDFEIEPKLRKSKIDFGLSTLRLNDQKHLDLFIKDIPEGALNNYLIASCFFPVFRPKKLENDSYYFDGGIYNNCPVNMLLEKGYDKVYAIDLKAVGFREKVIDEKRVINIKPSRKLSGIFSVNKEEINNNIKMGYYDTLKVLKRLDGNKYIFKRRPEVYYSILKRRLPKDFLEKNKTLNDRYLVIKFLEAYLDKNDKTYFNIYSPYKVLKECLSKK